MTDFSIVVRSLLSRPFSTITTAATVAVAVALLLVLLSMRDAGERAFSRGSGNMHLLISRDTSPLVSVLNGLFYANAPPRPIAWAEFVRLRDRFTAPEGAPPPRGFAVPVQLGDSYFGFPVAATESHFFSRFSHDPTFDPERASPDQPGWQLASGRFFQAPFEVVLGARVVASTGLRLGEPIFLTHGLAVERQQNIPVDQRVRPHVHTEFTYTVVGILEPTGSSHDRALFTDLTSSWIIHAHDRRKLENPAVATTTAADLIERDKLITGIFLRLPRAAAIGPVGAELRADPTLVVADPPKQIMTLFGIVGNIHSILVAMAFVVMISSGVAIMLALFNSMEQRRRQIAVLRVLGCSRPRVFGLILTESAMIGILGAAAGVALAFAGAFAVAGALRRFLGLVVEPALTPQWLLTVAAGAVALACVAGLVPGVMAYRTSVARSLRPLG